MRLHGCRERNDRASGWSDTWRNENGENTLIYDPSSTLRDARQIYFEANDFGNGGYDDRWVKLKAGPFAIWFPNTAARKRAVKFHDLHHVLTEYQTTWTGEAEIGAWEIASNCRDHYAAWILNLAAFGLGLFIAPSAVFQAFS